MCCGGFIRVAGRFSLAYLDLKVACSKYAVVIKAFWEHWSLLAQVPNVRVQGPAPRDASRGVMPLYVKGLHERKLPCRWGSLAASLHVLELYVCSYAFAAPGRLHKRRSTRACAQTFA